MAERERHRRDRQDPEAWRNSTGRDYSGISYGYSGGHAEDGTVHHSPAGLEAGYTEYGRDRATWRVPGPHAGRGPRGYRRPDERILEELNDRLTAHGLIDASDIDTRVQDGEVTLEGFVDSRAAKRAAEDLAGDITGVHDVHNRLRLRSHAAGTGVGRTSVLGLTESRVQTNSRMPATAPLRRSRSRT
jgi:hypothetical protein